MECRHMTCHQCEDANLVSLREEYEIMREDNEKLRALLAEALDLAEEGWGYADAYYKAKWRYDERLAALRPPKEGP